MKLVISLFSVVIGLTMSSASFAAEGEGAIAVSPNMTGSNYIMFITGDAAKVLFNRMSKAPSNKFTSQSGEHEHIERRASGNITCDSSDGTSPESIPYICSSFISEDGSLTPTTPVTDKP